MTDEEIFEAVQAYCILDELTPRDALLLRQLIRGAAALLAGRGIPRPGEGNGITPEVWLQCVEYMVLDNWERREAVAEAGKLSINPAFRDYLDHLRWEAVSHG